MSFDPDEQTWTIIVINRGVDRAPVLEIHRWDLGNMWTREVEVLGTFTFTLEEARVQHLGLKKLARVLFELAEASK